MLRSVRFMRSQNRLAISSALAVLVAIVVIGAAAGVYFLSNASPSVVTSTSITASASTSSSSSVVRTHITSSHSGTETVTINQTTSISSVQGTSTSSAQTITYSTAVPGDYIIFGLEVNPNTMTTQVFPNDTLIWTNYVTASAVNVTSVIADVVTTPTTPNSTAIVAFYVNGALLAQEAYKVGPSRPPASNPNYPAPAQNLVELPGPLPTGTVIPAGTTVSMAIWCSSSPTMYVNNDPNAHGTYEAPLTTGVIPSSLPSATSSLSYNPGITTFWNDFVP
jgi:hypothetical protein